MAAALVYNAHSENVFRQMGSARLLGPGTPERDPRGKVGGGQIGKRVMASSYVFCASVRATATRL